MGTLPLGRDSVSYRVIMEPATIAGSAGRALLLQVSHPLVAAGVAQHSDYEAHPWARLYRTLEVMMTLQFGSDSKSEAAARLLYRRHDRVRGISEDGEPYQALDPILLLWVWATLVDTMVGVHDRFVGTLGDADRQALYEEQLLVAEACGIPVEDCPATWAGFRSYVQAMIRDELVPTGVAQTVARQLRQPPLPFPVSRPAGALLGLLTAAQLPPVLRSQLGFAWTARHQIVLSAVAGASRAVTRVLPGRVRRAPAAGILMALSGRSRPPGLAA